MRALLVVLAPEQVKGLLLEEEVRPGGHGGLQLQREMHSLVLAVLLRLSGNDALEPNAEPEQPDRERRETTGAGRRERRAVVGPDRGGETELAKRGVEHAADGVAVGVLDDFAANEEPAEGIGDRERIADGVVVGAKVALEVDAPDTVGGGGLLERRNCRGRVSPPPPPRLDEPVSLQRLTDRAGRGERVVREAILEPGAKLSRPPARVELPCGDERCLDLERHRVRVRVRSPRAVLQDPHVTTGVPIAVEPHVAGRPTDAVRAAELANVDEPAVLLEQALPLQHELRPLLHGVGPSPGHAPRV